MADVERDALIRQVDEEVRREQLQKLWEKYSGLFIGGAVAIVVGVGGFKWYEARQLAAAESAGVRFESASQLAQSGKAEEARKAFEEIAKSGPKGYASLARLRVAGALAQAGKEAEALAAYEALGKDGAADPMLRDFARLQAASLSLQQASWTDMKNRLNDLTADTSAWRFSARELLGLAAWKGGMLDEARKAYEQLLGDRKVPQTIAERARVMMGQIVAAELAKAGGPGSAPSRAEAAPAGAAQSKAEAPAGTIKPTEKSGAGKR